MIKNITTLKNKTINYKLIIFQAIIILALWVVPFIIPFKYTIINYYYFLTYSLIPMLLFSAAFISYLFTFVGNKRNRKWVYIANVIDILAVVVFVVILLFVNNISSSQENINKAEAISKSINCNYFVGIPENGHTEYVAVPEKTVGHRPIPVDEGIMVFLDNTFSYYEALDMSLYKNKEDKKYTNLEVYICYIDDCPKILANALYKRTIWDIKNEGAKESENWEDYNTEDGYHCASYYQLRAYKKMGNYYVLLIEKNGQLLVVNIIAMFSDVNFDERNIDSYYIDIMRQLSHSQLG